MAKGDVITDNQKLYRSIHKPRYLKPDNTLDEGAFTFRYNTDDYLSVDRCSYRSDCEAMTKQFEKYGKKYSGSGISTVFIVNDHGFIVKDESHLQNPYHTGIYPPVDIAKLTENVENEVEFMQQTLHLVDVLHSLFKYLSYDSVKQRQLTK